MRTNFRSDNSDALLLPGRTADYLDTAALAADNRALLRERQVMLQILHDERPLPTTAARERVTSTTGILNSGCPGLGTCARSSPRPALIR